MSSQPNNTDKTEKLDFFDKPQNVTLILRVFYVICVLLVVADFIVHRHIYVSFEEIPAFYALYGFVACVVLVVIAKEMRKVFMKDETYYDKRDDENDDINEFEGDTITSNNTQYLSAAKTKENSGDTV